MRMPEERSKRSSAVPYRLLARGMNQFDAKRGTNRIDEDKNRKKKKKRKWNRSDYMSLESQLLLYVSPENSVQKKQKKEGFTWKEWVTTVQKLQKQMQVQNHAKCDHYFTKLEDEAVIVGEISITTAMTEKNAAHD